MPDMAKLYPVNLNLKGKKCLVVGGGPVALRKVLGLLPTGARIEVVSPDCHPGLTVLAACQRISLKEGPFSPTDLKGAFLVLAATPHRDLNHQIARAARDQGILVNRADSRPSSDFTLPALLRQGNITIAVSTNGTSPRLAQRIRDDLAATYGPRYAGWAAILGELRPWVLENVPADLRPLLWDYLTNPETLAHLESGDLEQAKELAQSFLQTRRKTGE